MNGGSKIIDLRVSDVLSYSNPSVETPGEQQYEAVEMEEEEDFGAPSHGRVAAVVAIIAGALWVVLLTWYCLPLLVQPPAPLVFAQLAVAYATPLGLIGILWLIARRSSKAEGRRFAATARSMRDEAAHLQDVIGVMARTIDSNREKLADQVTVMMATASTASERLQEASTALDSHFTKVEADAGRIDAAANNLEANLQILLATLPNAHSETAALAERITTLGLTASERTAALDAQVVALGERAREVDTHASGAAERLSAHITRMEATSETASARLETVTGQMSDAVDTLLGRTANAVDEARRGIAAQGDAMLAMLATNQATIDRTATDSAAALAERIAAIETVVERLAATLAAGQEQVDHLARSIDDSGHAAHRFAGEAAPQLLEALARVRDTANAAAEHAREAIERIIPIAGKAIETAGAQALEGSLSAISAATESATTVAATASDRLNKQMLAIAEASAQIDARLSETQEAEGFARRLSLLIEALNSTAIDLTRVYSTEVSDTTWAAYLKGDRGAFTRRAVRLLDNGEAKSVAHAYQEDETFRDQVNRYIHDFEAMLRAILAQREGTPMGVTLLSSDMGKLYVALAQAIERLR